MLQPPHEVLLSGLALRVTASSFSRQSMLSENIEVKIICCVIFLAITDTNHTNGSNKITPAHLH